MEYYSNGVTKSIACSQLDLHIRFERVGTQKVHWKESIKTKGFSKIEKSLVFKSNSK
jgi:hypothetical protein